MLGAAGLQSFEGCVLRASLLFLIWRVIKLGEGFVTVVESSGLRKSPLASRENRFDQESGERGNRGNSAGVLYWVSFQWRSP